MRKQQRRESLLPGGAPKYVRVYDNGGETFDRYTVLFTGRYAGRPVGRTEYVGMSENPCHPQGFGQHGEIEGVPDAQRGWPPAIGRKCHLGKRIAFTDLPDECQRVVMSDYIDLWNLHDRADIDSGNDESAFADHASIEAENS